MNDPTANRGTTRLSRSLIVKRLIAGFASTELLTSLRVRLSAKCR